MGSPKLSKSWMLHVFFHHPGIEASTTYSWRHHAMNLAGFDDPFLETVFVG